VNIARIDPMLTALVVIFVIVGLSFWRAQKRADFAFDLFDLIMEGGKVSKTAVAFMMVLCVTTWVIIDQQIKGTLSAEVFGLYGGMWVLPLVARVIFNKTDMPVGTSITSMTSTTVTKEPLP